MEPMDIPILVGNNSSPLARAYKDIGLIADITDKNKTTRILQISKIRKRWFCGGLKMRLVQVNSLSYNVNLHPAGY